GTTCVSAPPRHEFPHEVPGHPVPQTGRRPRRGAPADGRRVRAARPRGARMSRETATFFLCGDVMTGRGVDQILPHPNRPELHEPYVHDAREYVELAE